MSYDLTERQLEILRLVVEGASNTKIGKTLNLSPLTVNNHLRGIFAKMRAKNRVEAAVKAVREGLV